MTSSGTWARSNSTGPRQHVSRSMNRSPFLVRSTLPGCGSPCSSLLDGAAVDDRSSQGSQCGAEKLPVQVGKHRIVAARHQQFSFRDPVREVRTRDIERPHAGVQPLEAQAQPPGSQLRRAVEQARLRTVQPRALHVRFGQRRHTGVGAPRACSSCEERSPRRLPGQALKPSTWPQSPRSERPMRRSSLTSLLLGPSLRLGHRTRFLRYPSPGHRLRSALSGVVARAPTCRQTPAMGFSAASERKARWVRGASAGARRGRPSDSGHLAACAGGGSPGDSSAGAHCARGSRVVRSRRPSEQGDVDRRGGWHGPRARGLVLDEDLIDQLYVAPGNTGNGIGTDLVNLAKTCRPQGLRLWTFQTNSTRPAIL